MYRFFNHFLNIKITLEAKTYRFGSHPEAILGSTWGTLDAFRDQFGRLGANLSEHKKRSLKLKHIDMEAILRPFWAQLGVRWSPLGAIFGVLEPT